MQSIRIQKRTPPLPSPLAECLPPYLPDAVERMGLPWVEELRIHGGRQAFVTCKGKSYAVAAGELDMVWINTHISIAENHRPK